MNKVALFTTNLRILLMAILLTPCSTVLSQTKEQNEVTPKILNMNDKELREMVGDAAYNDPKVLDVAGNVIDPAEVSKMLKSFEYQIVWRKKLGGDFQKTMIKIDPIGIAKRDSAAKVLFRPKSVKLHEGLILDLKPLKKYIDRIKMQEKAILLIFWCDGCYGGKNPNAYAAVNEVLFKYKDPNKLEILTITPHQIEAASKALAKNPIVNTQHIVDARAVTADYGTENKPIIVLTDKSHKIIYSVMGNASMTPRLLDKFLREIL